jgi:hypothetical protein
MAKRELFSTLFMSTEASKAKIIMVPDEGGGGSGGSGGGSGPSGGTVAAPIITSIIADKNTITLGGWVKFTVNITNYFTSCIITGNGIAAGGVSVVSGVQSAQITPTSVGALTYTVTAINSNIAAPNSDVETFQITVLVLPQISSFTSTVSGNNVLLVPNWSPTSGTTAKILYGTTTISNVVSGTTYTVPKPTVSTTYTLEVRNEGGWGDQLSTTVSATALNPTINSFSSSSQTVDANTNFTLTPTFSNGTGVITRSKGTFSNGSASIACSSGTAITTTITETTTFTLKVTATQ